MASGDIRDAHRNYRVDDVPADRIRTRSRGKRREKVVRRSSRSPIPHSRERSRYITTRERLSADALIRDGAFLEKAQQVYSASLITSHGDKVTVHISELQQLNLELIRRKLVAHTFSARYNIEDYDLDGSIHDFTTYGNVLPPSFHLRIPFPFSISTQKASLS